MKKLFYGGIFLSMLFVTTLAMAEPVSYNISWIASGSYAYTYTTTYTTEFKDATFIMGLAGNTSNVTNGTGGTINEGMTGKLVGPKGETIYTNQFIGIQSVTNPTQSFIWGDGSNGYNSIIDFSAVASGLSTYGLQSAIGPNSLIDGGFVSGSWQNDYLFSNVRDFTFEAVTGTAVPLPSTFLLFGPGLLGLAGWRRFRKS
jgi:hypothetical protein